MQYILHDDLWHPSLDEPTSMDDQLPLPPLDTSSNLTSITKSHIELNAIEQTIHCSLHKDFLHLYTINATFADDWSDPIFNPTSLLKCNSKEPKTFNKKTLGMPTPLTQQSPCSNHLVNF